MNTRLNSAVFAVTVSLLGGCGVTESAEALNVEQLDDQGQVAQEVGADVLNVVPMELDVAPGEHDGRVARVLATAAAARGLLGPVLPSITFSRNWLIAYRPEGKGPRARVDVTRAQLSASGKTLSLWATLTEPKAECPAWRPNELSVVRVPARASVPTTVRVYLARKTADCGLIGGPTCSGMAAAAACPAATPFCLGSYERADGSFSTGRCVKVPRYEPPNDACANDAACGGGGICAGLSTDPSGLCQPSWMRGTWSMPESGQLSAPLPRDGSWYRIALPVSGQATVPMDAWVQLFLAGPSYAASYANVRYRLYNPSGTVSSTSVPLAMGLPAPLFVPGDETINGEWVVELQDVNTSGAPVYLRGVRLSLTSRWD
ncbi:MAG: hypothetical protein JNK82_11750 [Myxococcaceae bacterium]|nr:hypothetical protein [Myxococcaceae bacterium]